MNSSGEGAEIRNQHTALHRKGGHHPETDHWQCNLRRVGADLACGEIGRCSCPDNGRQRQQPCHLSHPRPCCGVIQRQAPEDSCSCIILRFIMLNCGL
ncbi:hypothetical protein BRADI_2g14351v3 [Brachypodium distachyon]|uniref:Uncharacterized protein n=1 Tax=Brachypodium distachyon TaxID=15368 RepID=A0A2K2D8K1_BRADI|nr:hypothetical protein BRADI_2g14351v3 [Brachypodium distachyon]